MFPVPGSAFNQGSYDKKPLTLEDYGNYMQQYGPKGKIDAMTMECMPLQIYSDKGTPREPTSDDCVNSMLRSRKISPSP
jgi:hypothetical protein